MLWSLRQKAAGVSPRSPQRGSREDGDDKEFTMDNFDFQQDPSWQSSAFEVKTSDPEFLPSVNPTPLEGETINTPYGGCKESEPHSCCDKLGIRKHYNESRNRVEDPGFGRIHHWSAFRRSWDSCTIVLLLYLMVASPVVLTFEISNDITDVMAVIVDWFFIADVFLNFVTTYEDSMRLTERRWRYIAYNYVTSWFVVDLVSSLPYERMPMSESNGQALHAVKLLKLTKLLRVLCLGRSVAKIQERYQIKHGTIQIFMFMLVLAMLAHWLGCLFYFSSHLQSEESLNWDEEYLRADERSVFDRYIACLYWSLTTMTTIGYGDITPKTTTERIVVTFGMVVGAFAFAYGLSTVCMLVFNRNLADVAFSQDMDVMLEYVKRNNVGPSFSRRITEYYWYRYMTSWVEHDATKEDELMEMLSPALRRDLKYEVKMRAFQRIPAEFRSPVVLMDSSFTWELLQSMVGRVYSPEERVWRSLPKLYYETKEEPAIRFLTNGSLEAYFETAEGSASQILLQGSTCGELLCLYDRQDPLEVFAKQHSDVLEVSRTSLLSLLGYYTEARHTVHHFYHKRSHDFVAHSEMAAWQSQLNTESFNCVKSSFSALERCPSDLMKFRDSQMFEDDKATNVADTDSSDEEASKARTQEVVLQEIAGVQERLLELRVELQQL